jgi:type IV secretion system protein VirD4
VVQPRLLFVAITLYLLDTPNKSVTVGEINRSVKNTSNFSQWVTDLLASRDDLDPLCYRNFHRFLQTPDKTRANILDSFTTYFELFDSPLIDAATSHSDFDIRELRKKRMTIYVGIDNDNLDRLAPLLTVFYQQVMGVLTREEPHLDLEPYAVLLLMDEFSRLKRLPLFEKNIGLLRSYRVRMMLIVQELAQMYALYGEKVAKLFINSKIRVIYTPNDSEDAQLISNWLDFTTVAQRSLTHHGFSFNKPELMTAGEIRKLSNKKAIITVEGFSPVLANRVPWFKDKAMRNRICGAIEVPMIEPVLTPFVKSENPEDYPEKLKQKEETRLRRQERDRIKKLHALELEKARLHAEAMASAVVTATERLVHKKIKPGNIRNNNRDDDGYPPD